MSKLPPRPPFEPTSEAPFDVLLSYNSDEWEAVGRIAEALALRHLRPWLDVEQLPPGRRWQEELETALTQVRTTAVLVGATGMGPWQEAEMRATIDESVRRKLPVIPVLLPGAPDRPQLPLFLRAFTWVDLRRGVTAEGLDRLEWGILGKKPGAGGARAKAPRGPLRHNLPLLSLGALFTGREQELLDLAADLDCVFRSKATTRSGGKATTDSDGRRPPIPV